MNIKGYEKTSLVDFPGHLSTTVFMGGCNMRCPFCHNKDLVLSSDEEAIPDHNFFDFLKKRSAVLEGVCITGGEPTLQKDLLDFLTQIKAYGLKTKLDTNGLNPHILEKAIDLDLIDYIAMDIKNSPSKYPISSGIKEESISLILQSVDLIKKSNLDYEFRTTIMKELHNDSDFIAIGSWLSGSKRYYLQNYKASKTQLSQKNYTSFSTDGLYHIRNLLLPFFEEVGLRG